jgi:preprotein translocase subunit SecE
LLILAGFVFFKSPQGIRFNTFLKETKIELRKVVWPTKDETIKTTGMIMVAVVIVAIFNPLQLEVIQSSLLMILI